MECKIFEYKGEKVVEPQSDVLITLPRYNRKEVEEMLKALDDAENETEHLCEHCGRHSWTKTCRKCGRKLV